MDYQPSAIPNDAPQGLRAWLASQFRQIADTFVAPSARVFHVVPSAAAPARFANGDVVYADGANWNPGSGEGFYGRQAGAWVKL